MTKINSNFGFSPLKEVWLGDCYPESYYDHLPNEIADPLCQITQWTKEDLTKLQIFLESRGITVQRPQFNTIDNYVNSQDNLIRPPITPRDHYITLGDTLYSLHSSSIYKKDPWQEILDLYKQQNLKVESPINQPINCLCPPSLVRVGKDLYLDRDSHQYSWGFICEWMISVSKKYRINICDTGGHSDGVFCPVAPGVLVTSHYKYNYNHSFPGWDVFRLPNNLHNFKNPKDWWTTDENINNNLSFSKHILENAQKWVGTASETVFEVNMLVIDEKILWQ